MIHCPNCNKLTGFKRALGFGTLFMMVLTFGLWLLVIPFYPARCITCGLTRGSAFWENLRADPRRAITASSVVAAIALAVIGYLWFFNSPSEHSRNGATPPPSDAVATQAAGASAEQGADSYARSSTNPSYKRYKNARFGFAIDFPQSFSVSLQPDNGDGVELISPDRRALLRIEGGNNSGLSLKDYYAASVKDIVCPMGYRKLGTSWFVVSWTCPGKLGYTKMFVGSGSHSSFTFTYPLDERAEYDNVVTRMEKSFTPGDLQSAE